MNIQVSYEAQRKWRSELLRFFLSIRIIYGKYILLDQSIIFLCYVFGFGIIISFVDPQFYFI